MKAQDLVKSVKAHVEALGAEVDATRASDEFRAWLDSLAQFHHYSFHNSMLILMQCPDATRVAGYRKWQELGRQVRKGEHAIRILAPCPVKRKATETGENGQERETERSVMFFKVVNVFDVSQTDGEALPTLDMSVQGDAGGLLPALQAVATERGIDVAFEAMHGGRHGYSEGGRVAVDIDAEPASQVKTLCHELAHEALHKGDDRAETSRKDRETEAEAVAYVACKHFGIDGGSANYLATWGADTEALMAHFERIHQTAAALITDLEAELADSARKVAA